MDDLLDRPLCDHERGGDRGVVLALCHLLERLALARRQLVERRVAPGASRDECFDDLRVDDRSSARDFTDRARQLRGVSHAVLEQIAATVGALLEQRERVFRSGELAEHDHARLGIRLP